MPLASFPSVNKLDSLHSFHQMNYVIGYQFHFIRSGLYVVNVVSTSLNYSINGIFTVNINRRSASHCETLVILKVENVLLILKLQDQDDGNDKVHHDSELK